MPPRPRRRCRPTSSTSGRLFFWGPTGTLLANQAFNLASRGTLVLNTSTIGGLAGVSGSVTVTNDAPYGTLVGKSVALDFAGFSFDAPMVPRAR